MNKVEKMIKTVVEKNFPASADAFLYNPALWQQLPIEHDDSRIDSRDVGDDSGREFFMWGISRWADGDIVAE